MKKLFHGSFASSSRSDGWRKIDQEKRTCSINKKTDDDFLFNNVPIFNDRSGQLAVNDAPLRRYS